MYVKNKIIRRKKYFLLVNLFFLLGLVLSCQNNKEVEFCNEAQTWEEDPIGQWYIGDFNVHATGASNNTDGNSFPIDIKRKALERSLDFLVLTDYSYSTGSDVNSLEEDTALYNQGPEFPYWKTAAMLSDVDFLMIDGNEISPESEDGVSPKGHIACIPTSLSSFDTTYVFVDRPKGEVSGANALQQATAAGCFKILNHPYNSDIALAFDWTSYNYDAIEVWNGKNGFDEYDKLSYDTWICDLLLGKQLTPIGGSDCHSVSTEAPGTDGFSALAYPSTAVFASSLTWDNIITGLSEGEVAIFEGNSRLYIDDYTAGKCRANGKDVFYIRLRGVADENMVNPVLSLNFYTNCADVRPSENAFPELGNLVLYEQELAPGESFDIAVEVEGKTGVFAATLIGESNHYIALSKAIIAI